ncbi:pectinesterase family protein [Acetobacter thailandicus]|uniref:Pectinesterase family protein n=1 Tax=Acetobacter thailandicus TaxID=1502842 RepID=A0ABT3QEG4_9PROT|nr:pectinesterase family protein [Acetobacter thailandicus]MCX2563677.1 pectinesterase family protein [Acetobacter thailandicus]
MAKKASLSISHTTFFILAALLLGMPGHGNAQDRRYIREPELPAHVCVKLTSDDVPDAHNLQEAINHCPSGQAVHLTKGLFVSNPLEMKSGVSLWLDKGVILAATSDPQAYDRGTGACGTLDNKGKGCKPFLTFQDYSGGGIYGDGVIDGNGGQVIEGKDETWWQLARRAQREHKHQNAPRLIQLNNTRDVTFYRVTLRNSPNFHVAMNGVKRATFWGVKIDAPASARNTDGIDPGNSEDVTITQSFIRTGDDNIAIKAGPNGGTHNISITDNHFYQGHGMSIGSETQNGVHDILVRNLTLDGTTSGIRIKSDVTRGGLVEHILYEDVCMRANRWAVNFDTSYDKEAVGSAIPVYRDITLRHVTSDGGQLVAHGFDKEHALDITLDGVHFPEKNQWDISNTQLHTGPLQEGAPDCSAQFVPFPENSPKTVYTVGSGKSFTSIQSALSAAPDGSTIAIYPGTYREVVHVTRPDMHLIGMGRTREETVIEGDRAAFESGGTGKSAIVFAEGDGDTLEHLTITNRFHWKHPDITKDAQALALSATGDRQHFSDLHLTGYQDTLLAASHGCREDRDCHPARQLYQDSRIDGAVDFIFGDALAWFERVELHALGRPFVILTAQGRRSADQPSGYLFHQCSITADNDVKEISLGRPWRDYATVVYKECRMDPRVLPSGFTEWNHLNRLTTARYGIVDASGTGAAKGPREPHMLAVNKELRQMISTPSVFWKNSL